MQPARPSLREAVNIKCKACIYDPQAKGAWREQVADCASSNCALHCVRPVPRHCMLDGQIDGAAVAAVRGKLAQTKLA
jgi:hypothetical protein